MRKTPVAIFGSILTTSLVIFFLACGSDTTATPEGGEGGTSNPSNEGGNPGDAGTGSLGCPGDAAKAPNGCCLKTTDYRSGAKAENVARTDITNGVNWENVEGAISEDGQFATVTLSDGQESNELKISDFQLNIPETADTWGIEVQLKRRAPDGGIEDSRVDLTVAGKTPQWKYLVVPWPRTIIGTHNYGQPVDTWKMDLYPSDVNPASFSARLWVKKDDDAGSGPALAQVDSLKVAVYYCPK